MKKNNLKGNYYSRRKETRILTIVEISLFLLFIFSTVMFIKQILRLKHEQNAFSELAVIASETEQNLPMDDDKSGDSAHKSSETQVQTSPTHYAELYEMNNDFIGWLNIPNTNIDYPVMFTPSEPEYYLRRAFDKTSSQSGTPFIGENCNIDSDCMIIYGHNMKNDTMFGTLKSYEDKDFWSNNKTFSFNTLYDYREYEVFATVKTNIPHTNELGFRYYNFSGDLSKKEHKELTDWLAINSVYDTGISPVYGEQILILSTCSYHTENGRFLVAARQIA